MTILVEARLPDDQVNLNNRNPLGGPPGGPPSPPNSCCKRVAACFKKAIAGIQHTLSFMAYAVTTTIGIKSVAKLGKSSIEFFKYVFKVESTGFSNLKTELGVADGVLDCAELIMDIKDWLVPKRDPADGRKKLFWRHKGVSRTAVAAKAFSTLSKVAGFAKFIIEIGLVNLGKISAALSRIPFFRVVLSFSPLRVIKDGFSIISSTLNTVDESIKLHSQRIQGKIEKLKFHKWQVKNEVCVYLAAAQEVKEQLLQEKYPDLELEFADLENHFLEERKNDYLTDRASLTALGSIPKREAPLAPEEKWEDTTIKYQNINAQELESAKCINKLDTKATNIEHSKIKQNKSWITIAFNVAKAVAATIGLIGLFASITALPVFAGILATMWLGVSIIGFVKLYHGFKNRKVLGA